MAKSRKFEDTQGRVVVNAEREPQAREKGKGRM